jgi:hypothetical protein
LPSTSARYLELGRSKDTKHLLHSPDSYALKREGFSSLGFEGSTKSYFASRQNDAHCARLDPDVSDAEFEDGTKRQRVALRDMETLIRSWRLWDYANMYDCFRALKTLSSLMISSSAKYPSEQRIRPWLDRPCGTVLARDLCRVSNQTP